MKHTRINFIQSGRPVVWRYGLGFIVAIACVALILLAKNERRLLLEARTTADVVATPVAPPSKPTAAELRVQRAGMSIAAQLNMPFFELMDALVPPGDAEVALMTLDLQSEAQGGAKVRIHITLQARSMRDMTIYLNWLQGKRQLRSAALLRHQLQDQVPGRPILFDVEVQA
jgi:hypothetical protein